MAAATETAGEARRDTGGPGVDHDFDELVSRREAFRLEAERYRALVELAPVALVVTDTSLRVLDANAAALRLLEVDPSSVLGRPLAVHVDLSDHRALKALPSRIGTSGTSVQVWMRRRTGATFEAELTVRRGRDELYWYMRDRTAEARAETRVRKADAERGRTVLVLQGRQLDQGGKEEVRRLGDIELDLLRHEVRVAGRPVRLTPTEYRLLVKLGESDRAFGRRELLEAAWDAVFVPDARSCDVHVANLRRKIEDDPRRPRRVLTVRGVGYRLVR